MISIKKVFDNGEDLAKISKSNNLYRWYEELVRKNHDYQSLKAEDEFFIDGVRFRTIWPYRSFINADFNSNSLVIVIEYGKFKCLLTGDLISSAEKEILKRSDKFKADILKVAHHGCDDASSIEFLKRVSPEISIISVDKDNINNFPSKKVLQRLKSIHSKVLRTDKSGNILIKINSEADIIKVLTER